MLKKIILGILVVLLLSGVVNLVAQEVADETGGERAQIRRGDRDRPQRGRFMREGFDEWLNELTEAYQQNDRGKMGQLLEDMKTRRQRMRDGRGGGRGEDMPDRRRRDRSGGRSADSAPLAKADAEKKILSVLEDMHQNQRRGMMNVPPEDGRVLRLLTEALGAKRVVEIGTSNGYSGIWFCLALRTTGGKLITHEINSERAELARKNFKRAGVDKIVTLVAGDAHEEIKKLKGPIDIVFIDADKEGYIDYLNKLLPMVRPGGLILAHNTSSAEGQMRDYLTTITTKADLETIFLHRNAAGIGVTLKKR